MPLQKWTLVCLRGSDSSDELQTFAIHGTDAPNDSSFENRPASSAYETFGIRTQVFGYVDTDFSSELLIQVLQRAILEVPAKFRYIYGTLAHFRRFGGCCCPARQTLQNGAFLAEIRVDTAKQASTYASK